MFPFLQGLILLIAGAMGYILSGYNGARVVLRKLGPINSWIVVPTLFYVAAVDRGLLPSDLNIFLLLGVFLLVMVPLLILLCKGFDGPLLGSVVLASTLMNSVNLPFSLLLILQGSYAYAAIFASGVSFMRPLVAMATYRLVVGRSGSTHSLTYIQGGMSLIGLLAGGISHYLFIISSEAISLTTVVGLALVIFAFGSTLRETGLQFNHQYKRALLVVTIMRALVSVAMISSLGYFFLLRGEVKAIREIALVSSMPPAVTDSVFARIYGFDVKFTVLATFILTPFNAVEGVGVYYLLSVLR
jgi:hypothetical protein